MTRQDVLDAIAADRENLRGMGVRSLGLFGSFARDEAGPESDIDLLVDFDRVVGLFTFLEVQEHLEEVLGRKVDLVTVAGLKMPYRDRILEEAVRAA